MENYKETDAVVGRAKETGVYLLQFASGLTAHSDFSCSLPLRLYRIPITIALWPLQVDTQLRRIALQEESARNTRLISDIEVLSLWIKLDAVKDNLKLHTGGGGTSGARCVNHTYFEGRNHSKAWYSRNFDIWNG